MDGGHRILKIAISVTLLVSLWHFKVFSGLSMNISSQNDYSIYIQSSDSDRAPGVTEKNAGNKSRESVVEEFKIGIMLDETPDDSVNQEHIILTHEKHVQEKSAESLDLESESESPIEKKLNESVVRESKAEKPIDNKKSIASKKSNDKKHENVTDGKPVDRKPEEYVDQKSKTASDEKPDQSKTKENNESIDDAEKSAHKETEKLEDEESEKLALEENEKHMKTQTHENIVIDNIIRFDGNDEEAWLRFVEHDFTPLAPLEFNPWKNNCSKEREAHPKMYNFTKTMTDALASERRLIRKELVMKAGVWTETECPSVVDYHSHVAAFDTFPEKAGVKEAYPIMTTSFAIRATCQLKIMERIMQRVFNSSMIIVSGTHLGAVRSGGMIAWDDDVDVWIPMKHMNRFLEECQNYKIKGGIINCSKSWNALKLYAIDDSPEAEFFVRNPWPHSSPYVDIFLYDDKMIQRYPDHRIHNNGLVRVLHPLRQWLVSGEVFLGPPRENSLKKHDLSTCYMSNWNHRFKKATFAHHIDCCVLKEKFPFSYMNEFEHKQPDGAWKTFRLEQTSFEGKVLASTVVDTNGVVLRMYSLDKNGKLRRISIPPLLDYDP